MSNKGIKYLDIFAGAGGLSEGFVKAGYTPIAHIEMDTAACFTLKTRAAYHWLKENNQMNVYDDYLSGKISRKQLYDFVPQEIIESVIEEEIGPKTRSSLFSKIDQKLKGRSLDLIIGGPPCQAYSLVGRSRDANNMIGDNRNYLYLEYVEFLKKYKPKYFVFENVLGLLSARDIDGQRHFDKMCACFKKAGYSTEYKVLNAKEYGVLQNRRRIIIIGKLGQDCHEFYPEIKKEDCHVCVDSIFEDLVPISAGAGTYGPSKVKRIAADSYLIKSGIRSIDEKYVTYHISRPNNERDLEIYKQAVMQWNEGKRLQYNLLDKSLQTHKNKEVFTDRFKVVAGNLPYSHTVVAHIAKDGHYYIHPDIKQNRSITPREAARLQTFPDDYYFEASDGRPARTCAFKQIGNAVPVLLAESVAEALKKSF